MQYFNKGKSIISFFTLIDLDEIKNKVKMTFLLRDVVGPVCNDTND